MQFKCLLKASLRDSHHSRLSDSSLLFVRFEVYVYYYYYYYDNTYEKERRKTEYRDVAVPGSELGTRVW